MTKFKTFETFVSESVTAKKPNDVETVDVDLAGDDKDIMDAIKKYKIKAEPNGANQGMGYDLTGKKKDLIAYLQSEYYEMDDDDIKSIYPELLEGDILDKAIVQVDTAKVINEAKQIASQRISARVEAIAYADGNMQIKDIKDNAAIDLYDNDGSIVALYYFLQKHSKSNLKESIDEAMVQVAGKGKPSGAMVLAKVILEFLSKEKHLTPAADRQLIGLEDDIAKIIMDSTF